MVAAVFSSIAFLMVQTGLAYTIKPEITGRSDWMLAVTLLVGFNCIALVICVVVLTVFKVNGIALPVLIAFLTNLGLWTFLPWAVTYANLGSRVPGGVYSAIIQTRGFEQVVIVPQLIAIFAIYYLPGVVWFWWLNLATFHVLLLTFVLTLRSEKPEVVIY